MDTNLRIRAAAMAAALVTSFVLLDRVASIGHPAGPAMPEAAQIAAARGETRS